ncbi:MAG: type IV pilus twitching motility protein PilT [Vulcanimicrobiaceae bacterium]
MNMANGALASLRLWDVLRAARERGASDVHIACGLQPAIRIGGALTFLAGKPVTIEELAEMQRLMMDQSQRTRLAHDADITLTISHPDSGCLRLHASMTDTGASLAFRLLCDAIPTFESLRLPNIVPMLLERNRGLLIFTGPTGSGKSTSLAAAIDYINTTSARRIISIEDPIEYRHISKRSVVTQRQVGRDVPSFAHAILASLRCDPDVILIGEMRDAATMHAALLAAETGHLILTTLHTGDAPQTIDRIVDAFEGSEQHVVRSTLANVLIGIVCQRLVRRPARRGYRVAAEILVASDAVRAIIRDGKTHQLRNVISTGREQGMQLLERHLAELIAEREIDLNEALRHTDRGHELRNAASGTEL